MLRTLNLICKYKHICGFIKYTFQYQDHLNFADVSIFLQKIRFFYKKQYLYLKHQYESCIRDSLVLFSIFVRRKVTANENVSFTGYMFGLLNSSKLVINPKNYNDATNSDIALSSDFLILSCFFLKFSYWSKFHLNIITSSRVMTIFLYRGLTRNL